MRVVEPNRIQPDVRTKKRPVKKNVFSVLLFLMVIGIILGFIGKKHNNTQEVHQQVEGEQTTQSPEEIIEDNNEIDYIFSGNEFRLLYENLRQPNVSRIDTPPLITGNDIADTRIREIAEKRGYKLRSEIINNLSYVGGVLLQPQVADDWRSLQNTAARNGLNISITSGYRTTDEQRKLFLNRLYDLGVDNRDVTNGDADEEVNEVLKTTAIPGYSKHHTGYTVDLLCAGWEFEDFKNSKCNDWLEENNFEIAKQYGFMPSYPPGADLQGPDPEAWEYVWVGSEILNPNL